MPQSPILQAMKQIAEEKNISMQAVIETIEAALAVAYRKDFGEKNQNVKVEFNAETAHARVFDVKTVVEDEKVKKYEEMMAEREKRRLEELEQGATEKKKDETPVEDHTAVQDEEEKEDRFDPKKEIGITEAQKTHKKSAIGDIIKTELFPPAAYGRMAAQTAKQVIIQRLREAERETIYNEFKDKEGQLINGTVQRLEGKMALIDLGRTTALLPPSEQVMQERYRPSQRLKLYVVAVNTTPKGPEIVVSRSHPDLVKRLFTMEVPEINNGSVEIKAIAREAGSRSKVAVIAHQANIDPVGSCVGQRGSRVQTIISELGGEKIDIIEWSDDPEIFIANALSPAKVLSVKTNTEDKTALAEVKEDQLSLAIGKAGQNVRLSAKLSGWKIDIVGEGGVKPDKERKKEQAAETPEIQQPATEAGEQPVQEPEQPAAANEEIISPAPQEPEAPKKETPVVPPAESATDAESKDDSTIK